MVLPFTVGQWGRWKIEEKKKNQELCFTYHSVIFPDGSDCKESACNVGDLGLIPGSGRSPAEGNGNPFQYSCLENPMVRGAWLQADRLQTMGSQRDTTEWLTHSVLLCHKRSILKVNNWQSKPEKESEENFRGQRPLLSCYTPGHVVPLFLVD